MVESRCGYWPSIYPVRRGTGNAEYILYAPAGFLIGPQTLIFPANRRDELELIHDASWQVDRINIFEMMGAGLISMVLIGKLLCDNIVQGLYIQCTAQS